jgi:predicted nucleic acid-binding protein
MDRVFVDTAAFIALQNRSDQYNAAAAAFSRELIDSKVLLVTTNLVLAETYSWLQRHPGAGYDAALAFGRWFRALSSEGTLTWTRGRKKTERPVIEAADARQPFCLLYADASIEEEAWRLFTQYGASGATYTDCISFAVMKMLGLKQAFTFDEHFAAAGFERVP